MSVTENSDTENEVEDALSDAADLDVDLQVQDENGNEINLLAEELNTGDLTDTDAALITYVARALASQSGTVDEMRTRLLAQDDAGNLAEVQAEELGTALGGTETALITYLAQALQSINNDSINTTKAERDEVTDTAEQDINASTYTNQFDVTAGMDTVAVAVDDAGGSFHVEVRFQDGNGNTIVTRDDDNSSQFSGDGSTDVFVDVELAAPQVEVAVVDDSGGANNADIVLRAN